MDNMSGESNGMMTSIWGPPGWFFMHTIAQNYPEKITNENKYIMVQYKVFFENIGTLFNILLFTVPQLLQIFVLVLSLKIISSLSQLIQFISFVLFFFLVVVPLNKLFKFFSSIFR